jgi:hypothetical protein
MRVDDREGFVRQTKTLRNFVKEGQHGFKTEITSWRLDQHLVICGERCHWGRTSTLDGDLSIPWKTC